MAGRGGNRARPSRRSEDTANQNGRDEAVARNPDVGGIFRRFAFGPHMRDRDAEFRLGWTKPRKPRS